MKSHLALVASLYAFALALRLVPLTFSPLPYNIDGFPLARIAAQITGTGTWRINPVDPNWYNEMMPVYSLVWSSASQLGGLDPLLYLQAVLPFVLATAVLPAYLLGVKAAGHPAAGFASGLFVAAFGSFLSLTSMGMKESLALVLLPTVILVFAERRDPRKRALALLLLLILPFLHQLSDFLVLGMVAALVVLTHARAIQRGRFAARALLLDIATGPGPAVLAYAYYVVVSMPDLDAVTSPDALALFLGVTTLLSALLVRMARPSSLRPGARLVRPVGPILLVPAIAFVALLVDARTDLFAGVLGTQPALVPIFLAAAALVVFAFLGYQLLRRTANPLTDLALAMGIAPVALVLFAFLRGLDGLSQVLVYRSFDFLDYGLALAVGVGFAYSWHRLGRTPARLALAVGLLGLLLATTPIAWNTQAVFGVDNVTTSSEFQALAVLASLHPSNVTTDQRLADVGRLWFGLPTDPTLPYRLRDNGSISGHDYALVLDRWTSIGAQVHPQPNIILSPTILSALLRANRVVFAAGPPGDRMYVVQLAGT
ncbi:MAG TPA: hypothetical protein VEY12_10510 [Thermoplasmata archaeon]|nr:hypothetical protein [Thermoplasmata archaeon]